MARLIPIWVVMLFLSVCGCSEEIRPPKTITGPVSEEADVRKLTINGDSAQAEPLRVESKQPLRFDTVVDLPDGWRRPHVGLVHAVKRLEDGDEISSSSGTLTISDAANGSLRLTAELPAPTKSGTYDLRGSVQINGRLVTVCSRPIEVVEAE